MSPSPSYSYRLGMVQMDSGNQMDANLEQMLGWVKEASQQGVSLLAFPEMCLYIGDHGDRVKNAIHVDDESDATMVRLKEAAIKNKIWLMLGSVSEFAGPDVNKVYNSSLLLGADGKLHAHYRKRHLFQALLPDISMQETHFFLAGQEPPPVVKTHFGRLGFSICFDVRFGEHYRYLRDAGAELVFVPSNFTIPTGKYHWEVLLRARAIENQLFIVAPAQVGTHRGWGYSSYGHSMLVDPWGEVLCCQPEGIGLSVLEVNLEQVQMVREQINMG